MLHTFARTAGRLRWDKLAGSDSGPLPHNSLWLDLVDPTPAELARVSTLVGVPLPTRAEMAEIEESSRLRIRHGTIQMTIMVLVWTRTEKPVLTPITFVLAGQRLVTIHDIDPQSFLAYRRQLTREDQPIPNGGETVMVTLIDGMIERTASVLRQIALELDGLSHRAFHNRQHLADNDRHHDPQASGRRGIAGDARLLRRLGYMSRRLGKAEASLASFQRLLIFLSREEVRGPCRTTIKWSRTSLQDVSGLDEHARFLSSQVRFLLDTLLGRVSVEQAGIIKTVSLLSMALFPPTLIASIYGMNFHDLAGLDNPWGYVTALLVMLLSAVLPILFFRVRGMM